MPRLLSLVTALALAATLFHAGPQQAYACTCGIRTGEEDYVRRLIEYSDVLVVGTVVRFDGTYEAPRSLAWVRPDLTYKGPTLRTHLLVRMTDEQNCGWEAHNEGERHLLSLRPVQGTPGLYDAGECASLSLDARPVMFAFGRSEEFFATLDRLLPPVPVSFDAPASDADAGTDGARPWQIAGGIALVAFGALAARTVVWRLRVR